MCSPEAACRGGMALLSLGTGQQEPQHIWGSAQSPVHSTVPQTHGDTIPPCSESSSAHLGTNQTNPPTGTAHHQCSTALHGLKSPLELHLLLPRGEHGIDQGILSSQIGGLMSSDPKVEENIHNLFVLKYSLLLHIHAYRIIYKSNEVPKHCW